MGELNHVEHKSYKYPYQPQNDLELDSISLASKESKGSRDSLNSNTSSPHDPLKEDDFIEKKENAEPVGICCKSFLRKMEGKLLILAGGTAGVFTMSLKKFLLTIPTGEFTCAIFLFSLLTLLPILYFQEEKIDPKGKLKFIIPRAFFGALAGVLKIWSIQEMNFGDAVAIFALCPLLAAIFSRILWKEKLDLWTILSLIIGIGGMVLVAQPPFIFGSPDSKLYSPLFFLVPIIGAILLGFAFSCMRRVGTEINSLVVPIILCPAGVVNAIILHYAKQDDKLVVPSCYYDRILLFCGGMGLTLGLILLNKGLAMEKSGPGVLMRNFDIVTAYLIQILIFNNTPSVLSIIGSLLILSSIMIVTVKKLFFEHCKVWEF